MTPPLAEVEFEIPERSGEVLCLPPAGELLTVARHNASMLDATALRIGGVPLPELRRRTRQQALEAAAAYTRALGIPAVLPAHDMLVLVTGHQPLLFHPGIWIKHLLVGHLATDGVAALSMPVDSDAAEEIGADVPHFNNGLQLVRETLPGTAADVPYEAQVPPTVPMWRKFLDRLDAHLRTLPHPQVREVFRAFARSAAAIEGAADIGTFITIARRRHEGHRRVLELPVSHLSRSPEFRQFFLHILRDCARFAESSNRHLTAYRHRYNVRTTAQPFPNLERDGVRIELPFWIVRAGRRHALFAERAGQSWRLWAQDEALLSIRDDAGPDEVEGLEIRPRAMTLTAFTRLCLADLFVHGVGGGRYDRATDAVIRDYFGIIPPSYAVVTATLHLPLAEFNTAGERHQLQRRLLELRHNPERVLSVRSEHQQKLIDEKWRLIAALDGGGLTRRARRQITQRIREINALLSGPLGDERDEIERRLEAATVESETTTASTHRGYPFCFFSPQALDHLIESTMLRG